MDERLSNIISELKSESDINYVDKAFSLFIDNQLTDHDLADILSIVNYKLPDSFFKLHKFQQKKFWKRNIRYVSFDEEGNFVIEEITIFNKPYFYHLVECSKKSKLNTKALINYIREVNHVGYMFYAMEYIKISNTNLSQYDKINEYVEKKGINDLLSLILEVESEYNQKDVELLKSIIEKNIFCKDKFDFDLNQPFNILALLMECVLFILPRKERNTLKIKFLILEEENIKEDDYLKLDKKGKQIVKDYRNVLISKPAFYHVKKYVKENAEVIDKLPPNGYLSLYYALIEE